jgi:hypothetical protein
VVASAAFDLLRHDTAVFATISTRQRAAQMQGVTTPHWTTPKRCGMGPTNTALLRQEGLLEFLRGRGITVAGLPSVVPLSSEQESLSSSRGGTATASMSSWRSSKNSAESHHRARLGEGLESPSRTLRWRSRCRGTPPR